MNILTTLRRPLARLLLCAGALAATVLPAQAAVFSDGFENGLWTGGTVGTFTREATGRAGGQAVKVVRSGSTQSLASAPIAINPNDAHRVSVWVRSQLPDSEPDISVSVRQLRSDGNTIGWAPQDAMKAIETGGTQNWTRYTVTLPRLHSATATVRLFLRVESGSAGPVWFDDVSIESVNTLANPGFDGALWPETGGGFTRDAAERHGGSHSAKVVQGATERYLASSPVPVDDQRGYVLAGWIKTTGITPAGASIKVMQLDASGRELGWYVVNGNKLWMAGGTTPWSYFSVTLRQLVAGTARLKVHLRTDAATSGPSVGTAWFDDLVLTPTYRDNFLWGVSGHTARNSSQVYHRDQLDLQLYKAAGLGGNLYRVNLSPSYDAVTGLPDWSYLDALIGAARGRGQQVCLVLFDEKTHATEGDPRLYAERAYAIAARYRGQIAYYQMGNELDTAAIRGAEFDGSQSSHYDEDYLPVRDWLRQVSDAIRTADPYAKRMINIAWKHTGFLEMLAADGVTWDVNALDWYADNATMQTVLERLQGYTQNEILIAEYNIRYGTRTASEEDQRKHILSGANWVYYRAPSKVKGFLVYELFDEGHLGVNEAHYGLVRYTPGTSGHPGVMGPDKAAYGGFKGFISELPK